MKKAVICTVQSENLARQIVARLHADGFPTQDISVLFPDPSAARDFAYENNTKAPEGAIAGATGGAVAGGTLGLLAGIGTIAIPGVGPFIAAGPILAALSGMAAGSMVGGMVGALVGLGIPEIEAKQFAGRIREGRYLIAVHTENGEERKRVSDVFETFQVQDIMTTSEKDVPAPATRT